MNSLQIEKIDKTIARQVKNKDGTLINYYWTDNELILLNKINELIDEVVELKIELIRRG